MVPAADPLSCRYLSNQFLGHVHLFQTSPHWLQHIIKTVSWCWWFCIVLTLQDQMDHHRHNHHRPEEEYPPPPPPPQVTNVHHTSHNTTPSPPPPQVHHSSHYTSPPPSPPPPQVHQSSHYTTPSPPPPQVSSHVHHSSHDITPPAPPPTHHTASHDFHQPPTPHPAVASVQHVSHTSTTTTHQPHHETSHNSKDPLANKPTVKVYCKAKTDYSLTIRDGKVILAPSNPSDPLQHWVKDEKYSTKVKDEEGFPSFSLVNKATGQAMKHSIGATHPVQLIPYNPDHLDESILWTESKDLGDTYRAVRMVNNIRLNVDAFNGDKEHGGVHNGTKIVLWEWAKGDNQRWKIVPY